MFGKRKFTIIPNGRNLKKYEYDSKKRIEYRNKLGIASDALVIGHVGRFNRQKNHEYLVRVFSEVYKKKRNSYLVLVGTGEKVDEIKTLVKELELQNNVIFTGVIENVSDYLSAFDVMLLPSLYEGLPLVVIEWQIAGLSCIVSDTVTKECAITSLVKFESIKKEPVAWANDIGNLTLQNRNDSKEVVFSEIKTAGYDIESGAEKLRQMHNLFNAHSSSPPNAKSIARSTYLRELQDFQHSSKCHVYRCLQKTIFSDRTELISTFLS